MFLRYISCFSKKTLLLIPFVFLFPVEGFSTEDNFSDIETLKESTVNIFAKSAREESVIQGSGFFITENLLVTNYHIVEGSLDLSVFIQTQSMSEDIGSVIVTSPESDLAIIKTSESHYKPIALGNLTDVNTGEGVFFIGSPEGKLGTVSEGVVISKVGSEFLSTTTLSFDGASGSPLFSEELRTVVGIVSGSSHGSGGGRMAIIVSVDRLRALIKENRRALERATGRRIGRNLYKRSFKKGFDFSRNIKTPTDMFLMGRALLYIADEIDQSYRFVDSSDVKSYVYWYERAAIAGLAEAQYVLGMLYHEGSGVEKNPELRDYWLSRASAQGHLQASEVLNNITEVDQKILPKNQGAKGEFSCWG